MTLRLDPNQYSQAAEILRRGGTVAFPTETVYGLGADATNASAIQALFTAKGRPSDNPLIVHLRHVEQLNACCRVIPDVAYRFMAAFCPGPLTIVLPKQPSIVDGVTAGLDTVAVRFPSHPTAQKILEAAGLPIAAPSANQSGRPSATTWQAVLEDLDGRIDAVMCDGATDIGLESTVLDLSQSHPIILRHGAITLEQLRDVEPTTSLRSSLDSNRPNSPGLRHRHYQPRCNVVLCDGPDEIKERTSRQEVKHSKTAYIGLSAPNGDREIAMLKHCQSLDDYARFFFDFFRQCDAAGIETIYCQRVEEVGLGRAMMDRLRRAAGDA
ncbi:MAG: L-threonylcarbamoyladenylate synthase [Pirellulaceae bacterium]|nr:L-threonylcarbamoyladenylate synthase [Pirellulaceae bacterium]